MPAHGGWGLGRAVDMMAPRKTRLTPYPLVTGLRALSLCTLKCGFSNSPSGSCSWLPRAQALGVLEDQSLFCVTLSLSLKAAGS